jgi:hypothetical protein
MISIHKIQDRDRGYFFFFFFFFYTCLVHKVKREIVFEDACGWWVVVDVTAEFFSIGLAGVGVVYT